MSDDLVKDLRTGIYTCDGVRALRDRAADRIETLEAALREIVGQIKQYDLPAPVVTLLVMQKAEKALEGKDD